MFTNAKDSGIKLIDGAIGKFKAIITNLETGIKMVEEQKQGNEKTISTLSLENKNLTKKASQAKRVRDNLSSIIEEDVEDGASEQME
jgi:hypothetical protein